MPRTKDHEPGAPQGISFSDERLPDKVTTVRFGPMLWWRLQRRSGLSGIGTSTLIKQLVAEGLGRFDADEQLEYRRHVKSYTDYHRRVLVSLPQAVGPGPEPARERLPERPTACTLDGGCGSDMMWGAQDDGTASCRVCGYVGRWLPEGRTVADYA